MTEEDGSEAPVDKLILSGSTDPAHANDAAAPLIRPAARHGARSGLKSPSGASGLLREIIGL
ncbi:MULTISPECIES: hypothetical protein [unclassified Streptomyces]|uniref:hypothetical protein n=1 Tax=unclassified Streptomyces TaxID=2593676 RepID=UPI000A724AAC|nr:MULTISPECIES: hypothetical protein [unclassified Streptomyces]